MFINLRTLVLCALAISCLPAQTVWTPPVLLGPTSDGKAALAMNSAGTAFTTFGNTPTGGSGVIYSSLDRSGVAWPPASVLASSSYDASHPTSALDATGASVTIFTALQYDGYNNAYVACWASADGVPTSCYLLATPIGIVQPLVRAYGTSTTVVNNALALIPSACQLEALVSYAGNGFSYESPLLNSSDCLSAFDAAVNASGNGAAVYRTKTGVIGAATRTTNAQGSAFWSTPVQLAGANTQNSHVALSSAPDGTVTVAYTVGKAGTKTIQIWSATKPPSGLFGAPVQLSGSACDLGVAVSTAGNNKTIVAWAAKDGFHCAPTVAIRPAGGSFAAPVKLTSNALATLVISTATQQGSFVVAWLDRAKSAVYAATATVAGFTPAVKIGGVGFPALAAGGGHVSAVVCGTTCSASSLALQ